MRMTWRMWVLGIALALSIVSIISATSTMKLTLFILLIGILLVPYFVKSNMGRVIIIAVFICTAVFLVYSSIQTGVVVKSIDSNSDAFNAGLKQGDIIKSINNNPVTDMNSYTNIISGLFLTSKSEKIDITTKTADYPFITNETPKITVGNVPKTNIQTGLDLRGGARALVQADTKLTDAQMNDLIAVSRNRFNVFGLSDVSISGVSDLQGNRYMLVEVAGAAPSDLESLIAQQGKFEAKVDNQTVFVGGNKDISDVCRNDANCAGITACSPAQSGTGYVCNFQFAVYLKEAAAQRHAQITSNISLDDTGKYLSEKLYLYVDDKEVDSLLISTDLKGKVTTEISVQGSGSGATQNDAILAAKQSMNKLQTILITGSLPYKLSIVKLDTVSPSLGEQFVVLILLAGAASLIAVAIIIFFRYRKLKPSLLLLFTSFSEVIVILGVASMIKWNLDLPSIAGILATIGTGVDQQIVILDESESKENISLKEKLKRAMFIIGTAYATSVVSMIPLYWAGAGLFKGFAITTIIGITAGVLITRPAFADMVKSLKE